MRQLVLDTETTGLDVAEGHRIIEIGCVEIVSRRLTHRHYHQYVNPERDIDEGALGVHGITRQFLADKPLFADVWDGFLEFVEGSELIMHNAAFDIAFINQEMKLMPSSPGEITDYCTLVDSLELARNKHPGQKNNLDALCKRYNVDNSHRDMHGALLDAEILADVYLLLTGGQGSLGLGEKPEVSHAGSVMELDENRPELKVVRATVEEAAAHEERLDRLDELSKSGSIWRRKYS